MPSYDSRPCLDGSCPSSKTGHEALSRIYIMTESTGKIAFRGDRPSDYELGIVDSMRTELQACEGLSHHNKKAVGDTILQGKVQFVHISSSIRFYSLHVRKQARKH